MTGKRVRNDEMISFLRYTMVMAFAGHTCMHIPHPLQYSRFICMGMVFFITASGQYSQHRKHDCFFCLAGMHLLLCITGIRLRHSPVLPASPIAGDDSSHICLQSLCPMALFYFILSSLVTSYVFSMAARLISTALLVNLSLITFLMLGISTICVAQVKAPNMAVFTIGSPPTINPSSRQILVASAVAMLKSPLILSSLGCCHEFTISHPPLLKPLITSLYFSKVWSSTTTAFGFST